MHNLIRVSLLLLLACGSSTSHAALNVFACEPEWADLVTRLGGERVTVSSATTGMQDPHLIEARPSLIARTRNADLVVCTGMDLEAGWLPVLLAQSGNPRLAPGRPGYFEAGGFATPLEVPARVDRSDGDVHPYGNPHVHLDPRNLARIADALAKRLAELDPPGAAHFAARHQAFASQWSDAQRKWAQQAAPLKGVALVEHHRNMAYLFNWLGMRSEGTLEPKPGIEPSAAHLKSLLKTLEQRPVKMVVYATYQDSRAAQWMGQNARVPIVALPLTIGGTEKAVDLFSLYDDIIGRLSSAAP